MPADVPLTPEQRVVEAGHLVPTYGAVTGWGALRWCGARGFDGVDRHGGLVPVTIATPRQRVRAQPGIVVCQERFDVREAVSVDGIWVTHPVRSVCFEMRYARSEREAVVAFASAALHDLVSLDEVAEWMYTHASYTGIGQGRDCLALCDENCWSQMEARLLHSWVVDLQLPRPLMNQPLFDLDGRHIGTPDLIDVEAGVLGQYDGRVHLAGRQRRRDLTRDARYSDHGLEQVIAMAGDLGTRSFAERVRHTYLRASRRPASDRRWTIELPDWWVPTLTVAQRRALSAYERRRWLGFRDAA